MSDAVDKARLAANRDAVAAHLRAQLGCEVRVVETRGQGVWFYPEKKGIGHMLITEEVMKDEPEPERLVGRICARTLEGLRQGAAAQVNSTETFIGP